MKKNFLLVFFSVVICTSLIFSQDIRETRNAELTPYTSSYQHQNTPTDVIWDIQNLVEAGAGGGSGINGHAGLEFDGTYYYTTRWATNLIYKFDKDGFLIESFSIPGVTGLRDLAYDGTYFYGGASGTSIYEMDFTAKTLISTITISGVTVRNIAYDSGSDGFWTGNWGDSPILFSRTGTPLDTMVTGLTGQYGSAYQPADILGGPYLWMFDQGGGACPGGLAMHQFNIVTGLATGLTYDACTIPELDGIAGGMFTATDHVTGTFSIGALCQGSSGTFASDRFVVLELGGSATTGPGLSTLPNPTWFATNVDIDQDLSWSNAAGATSIEVFYGTNPAALTSIYSGAPIATWDQGTMAYSTTYYWYVNETDGSGTTVGFLWSFTTAAAPVPIPFSEDFEGGTLPAGWGGNMLVGPGHGTGASNVLYRNLYSSVPTANANTLIIGPVTATTNLEFDYAITDWPSPGPGTVLGADYFDINISTDGGSTFTTVYTINAGNHVTSTSYAKVTVPLGAYTGSSIVVQWDLYWASGDYYFDVDNVFVREPPLCTDPTGLTATNMTNNSVDIGWTGAVTVEIDYGAPGHAAGTGTILGPTTTNPYTVPLLTVNTAYDAYVRQDCGGGLYSNWVGPVNFATTQVAATLPFNEDFETWPNNWMVLNGTETNQWHVGTATAYAGTQSAYVSNDGGTTNAYDGNSPSIVHLYRDIAFSGATGGGFQLSFWHKGIAETIFDNLKVYLVDTEVVPTAGTELTVGQIGEAYYVQDTVYAQKFINLPDALNGSTMRVVFVWDNDNSVTNDPPSSVDDVNIRAVTPGTLNGTITNCYTAGPLAGATVNAGTYSTTTNGSGFYNFAVIPPGNYDVTASLAGYESKTVTGVVVPEGGTTTQDMCLDEVLYAPVNLQATVAGQDVGLTWEVPPAGILQWDDGINANAIGTGGAAIFDVAHRHRVEDLSYVDGKYLKKVRFFPNEVAATYTITLWVVDPGVDTVVVHTQLVTTPVIGAFNTVTLSASHMIDASKELWIGYNVNATAGFPAGCDLGPNLDWLGNLIYWVDGWYLLTDLNPALTYNWNITGYVYNTSESTENAIILANADNRENMKQNNDKHYLKNVTFSALQLKPNYEPNSDQLIKSGSHSGIIDATLTGYNIYRDAVKIDSNIAVLSYDDLGVPYGIYEYQVSAQYLEGESDLTPIVVADVVDPTLDTIYVFPQSANYWTGTTDGTARTDTSEVRCWDTEDGWMMFDVTAIDDAATIVKIIYHGYVNDTNWPYWSATPLPGLDPLTADPSALKDTTEANSGSGDAYLYQNEGSTYATGWKSHEMINNAAADLEAALAQDWFAMGMDSRDNSATYYVNWDGWAETNVPYLEVVYSSGATTFPLDVDVVAGWNMVSVPGVNPGGSGVSTWWPNLTGSVFAFSGGYVGVSTVTTGEGYWLNNSLTETYSYPAIEIVSHDPIPVPAGWSMIGPYENTAPVSGLIPSVGTILSVFGYSGGYFAATDLVPGYGFWINMSDAGTVTIPDPPLAKGSTEVVEYFKEDWGKITITDNAGRSITLYSVDGEVNLDKYELPPMPPSGMFDIRYGSGRIAEDISSSIQSIDMTGIEYPLTVKVENIDIRLQDESGKEINENVKSGEEITISNTQINKLMVTGELIPDVYALEQNYPNPFNPSTVIEFSLPEDVKNVKLTIYDILGQRVTQLVNTSLVAGKYRYQWNAGTVATGMYIYELRTDKFVSVKKMMLLK